MNRIGWVVCALLWVGAVSAQPADPTYYPYAEPEERTPMLLTDSALFYRAVQSAGDLYGRLSDYNLPQVALRRRGETLRKPIRLSGLELSDRYDRLLYRVGAEEELSADMRRFSFAEGEWLQPMQASVWTTDRSYRVGARICVRKPLSKGWHIDAVAEYRTGRDAHIEGVFTHAVSAGVHLTHRDTRQGEWSLLLLASPSLRGTRLSSTEEAFSLTDDRYYNPAWGYQHGKVRNSRVRRDFVPLALTSYAFPLSASTVAQISAAAEIGVQRYSALGWYDARTPMPDNYRYLPSYTEDAATQYAWLAGDPRYTQVNWDEMIRQNRMSGGAAVYALEDRVERKTDLQANLTFTTEVDRQLTLRYGLSASSDRSRFYKQMRDLLGAKYIDDVDYFLIDDATYRNLHQNDARNPNRRIAEHDRFGYDYALTIRQLMAQVAATYVSDRFRADLSAEIGTMSLFRRGYYEKELFPGDLSYGKSRVLRFTPYRFGVQAGWAFSPRRYLELTASIQHAVPDADDLFYQPLYNNRTIADSQPEKQYRVAITYRQTGAVVEWSATLYASSRLDGVQTSRYYDDLAALYCNRSVTGIGEVAYGVEAAAEIRLSYRWRASLAASGGYAGYIRDPRVTVLSDVDNATVDQQAVSRMGGCRVGGAPQLTALAGLSYFGAKGWGGRLGFSYAGLRYVTAEPLRRTDRIAGQGGVTEQSFEAFTRQERLADAFSLDVSVFKTFYFDRSRLTLALMMDNLTGEQVAYNGYESMRVRRITAGDGVYYAPHATRYTYAYPRSFYATIGYKF